MNLRQCEYALAVAEEGSMTAAAERLRVTQPSLSQQIGALESTSVCSCSLGRRAGSQ